jgi:molybdopterin-guanine dinucleotide biosynthesis protein A
MGSEKGLVMYKGKTFIQWILEAVTPVCDSIYLITNNKAYASYNHPLIRDVIPEKGPVGGIYTALKHSSTPWNLILSCDVPMLTTDVLQNHLLNKLPDTAISYLSDGRQNSPLIGLYAQHLVGDFEKALRKDHLKLLDLIHALPHSQVTVKPEEAYTIQNINTPTELNHLM